MATVITLKNTLKLNHVNLLKPISLTNFRIYLPNQIINNRHFGGKFIPCCSQFCQNPHITNEKADDRNVSGRGMFTLKKAH